MPKYIIRILSFLMAAVICILAGVAGGIQIQANTYQNRYEAELLQSSKIGVVNQDMGVVYLGRAVNFAEEIIKTLPDGYVLLSKAEAEHSINQGGLAAVITFPGDFSKKIAGINFFNPDKAMFTYKINDKLSQKDTIETILEVMNTGQQVSESISYMFVASIFNELHQAQINVNDIVHEGDNMVKNVQGFKEINFYTSLEFSQVELNYPKIQMISFAEFLSTNRGYLASLDDTVRKSLENINTGYQEIVAEGTGTLGSISAISDAVRNIELSPEYLGEVTDKISGQKTKELFSNYFEFVEFSMDEENTAILADLERAVLNARNDIFLSLGSSNFNSLQFSKVSLGASEKTSIELLVNQELEALYDAVERKVLESYKENIILGLSTDNAMLSVLGFSRGDININSSVLDANFTDYLNALQLGFSTTNTTGTITNAEKNVFQLINETAADLLDNQIKSDYGSAQIFFDKYMAAQLNMTDKNFREIKIPTTKVDHNTKAAFGNLRAYIQQTQTKMQSGLQSSYTAVAGNMTKLEAMITAFEVFRYYEENRGEINELHGNAETNLQSWNEDINKIITEREDIIYRSYEEYGKNIQQLMEEANFSKEQAENLLTSELEKTLVNQINSYESIKDLTEIFAGKLPNSHIGTQENTGLYNFVVAPVGAADSNQSGANAGAFAPPADIIITKLYTPIIRVAAGMLLLLAIVIIWVLIKRYKSIKQ